MDQASASLNVSLAFAEPAFDFQQAASALQRSVCKTLSGFSLDPASLTAALASAKPSEWVIGASFQEQRGQVRVGFHGLDVTLWYPSWSDYQLLTDVLVVLEPAVLGVLPECRLNKRTVLFQGQVPQPPPPSLTLTEESLCNQLAEQFGSRVQGSLLARFDDPLRGRSTRVWLEPSEWRAGWTYLSIQATSSNLDSPLREDLSDLYDRLRALWRLFDWEVQDD
ncbi:MAG: hypothetical protein U0002_21245 [Thermoanaerobaculia bacterium]